MITTFRKRAFAGALMLSCVGFGAATLHAEDEDGDVRAERATTQLPSVGKVVVTPQAERGEIVSLRDTPSVPQTGQRTHFEGLLPYRPGSSGNTDGALQSRSMSPTLRTPSPTGTFLGVGKGMTGFTVNSIPPDTVGAVGRTQYVQVVNSSFAVFNKAGTKLLGPTTTKTLFSTLSGGCKNNNDGDGVVVYDKLADRWVVSQFSVSSTPYSQCVAVSKTSDATGGWWVYAFSYGNATFTDYPKMGTWPDGYYVTFNDFNAAGTSFLGSKVCAYDRTSMLSGAAATQQCVDMGSNYGGVLPSDADGVNPPPNGAPNYLAMWDTNSLDLWKFHVDWTNTANTSLTGPVNLPVAAFSYACDSNDSNDGTCVPQKSSTIKLDSLSDRLMYRLAYYNFGDHESLTVSHSVRVGATAASQTGVRWYELRDPNGTPTVYQQSTFSPDTTIYRWMPSLAMDTSGNMALGYSTSSGSDFPSIAYTGRLATDTPSTMQAEVQMQAGTGSQTGSGNTRWGDYSGMTLDPADGCTFWYTTEYLTANGSFNWSTRVGNFVFPSCAPVTTYVVGGDVSGLGVASGLVLSLNSGAQTATVAPSATSYAFSTGLANAATYAVAIQTQPSGATCTLSNGSGTVASMNINNVNVKCVSSVTSYTVGGSATGLTGSNTVGLKLTDTTSSTSQTIASQANGSFTFGTALTAGHDWNVTVVTQPTGQTCSVTNGSGTNLSGNVTNVSVTCTTNTYTIGGAVGGLTGSNTVGLKLTDTTSSTSQTIASQANGNFTFGTALNFGDGWNVTLVTQPTGQTCAVTNGSGTNLSANVTNVSVTCTTNTYTIGGAVGGLTGSNTVGLKLTDTTSSTSQTIASQANGSFTFGTALNFGDGWNVTVVTQPTGQTCSVTNGSGTNLSANVTNVSVTCTTNTYTIGGAVGGLTGSNTVGLKLTDTTSSTTQTIASQANGSFTFGTALNFGDGWNVTVVTQPTGQTCVVANGSGTNLSGNVSTVQVTCTTNTYTLTYTAGANGSLTGTTSQTVNYGANGTPVAAIPATDYHFVQWSDGSTANPRTDTNVTANLAVTATFAANVLVFTTQPANLVQGGTLGTIAVAVQDGSGNTLPVSGTADFTIAACGGSVDLGSVTISNGVATLASNQAFHTIASGLTVKATSGSLSAVSAPFSVGTNTDLVFENGFDGCHL